MRLFRETRDDARRMTTKLSSNYRRQFHFELFRASRSVDDREARSIRSIPRGAPFTNENVRRDSRKEPHFMRVLCAFYARLRAYERAASILVVDVINSFRTLLSRRISRVPLSV